MNIRILAGGIAVLALWIVVSAFSLVDTLFLATPWDVGVRLVRLALSGRLFLDLAYTAGRALSGFCLSAIIGVPLGLFLGWSQRFRDWVNVPVEFLRSLPAPVLFPLFIILFGIGDLAKVAGVVFACLFPIAVQTGYGVINANRTRVRLTERMGFNQWKVLVKIVYPEALPYVFVGLRNALSLSIIATVVVEMMMAGRVGLGYSIFNAYQVFRISEMYAYIIVTGLLGWVVNKLFLAFERRKLHWVGR
jgi:ABC-type nitrate/sulfonate/bicarbonate transport system permease component